MTEMIAESSVKKEGPLWPEQIEQSWRTQNIPWNSMHNLIEWIEREQDPLTPEKMALYGVVMSYFESLNEVNTFTITLPEEGKADRARIRADYQKLFNKLIERSAGNEPDKIKAKCKICAKPGNIVNMGVLTCDACDRKTPGSGKGIVLDGFMMLTWAAADILGDKRMREIATSRDGWDRWLRWCKKNEHTAFSTGTWLEATSYIIGEINEKTWRAVWDGMDIQIKGLMEEYSLNPRHSRRTKWELLASAKIMKRWQGQLWQDSTSSLNTVVVGEAHTARRHETLASTSKTCSYAGEKTRTERCPTLNQGLSNTEKQAKKAEFDEIWKKGVGTFVRTLKKPKNTPWLKDKPNKMLVAWVKQSTKIDSPRRAFVSGYLTFEAPVIDLTIRVQADEEREASSANTGNGQGPSSSDTQTETRARTRPRPGRVSHPTTAKRRTTRNGRVRLDLTPPPRTRTAPAPRLESSSAQGGAEVSGTQRWLRHRAG